VTRLKAGKRELYMCAREGRQLGTVDNNGPVGGEGMSGGSLYRPSFAWVTQLT